MFWVGVFIINWFLLVLQHFIENNMVTPICEFLGLILRKDVLLINPENFIALCKILIWSYRFFSFFAQLKLIVNLSMCVKSGIIWVKQGSLYRRVNRVGVTFRTNLMFLLGLSMLKLSSFNCSISSCLAPFCQGIIETIRHHSSESMMITKQLRSVLLLAISCTPRQRLNSRFIYSLK